MHIVHGRPRHPQSQGLIERANAILTDALGKLSYSCSILKIVKKNNCISVDQGKWMDDKSTNHWSEGLSTVIYQINTRTTHTTKKTPYELAFGQKPKSNFHYWKSLHDSALHDAVLYDDLLIDKISDTTSTSLSTKKDTTKTTITTQTGLTG